MMDVGMYGHGHQHGGGNYNQPESFYGYATEVYSQSHGSTHPLPTPQYATSYHYEETPYLCSTDSADAPPSPQDINFYQHQSSSHSVHHGQPENQIISTESGLSYTNLDYANSPVCPNAYPQQQAVYSTDGYQRTQSDMMLRHHDGGVEGQFYQDTKYHAHQLDNEGYAPHLVLQNVPTSCVDYQNHRRYKEEVLNSDADRIHCSRPHHGLSHMASVAQPTSAIPTYKWMQVKRNVPKPQGKLHLNITYHSFNLKNIHKAAAFGVSNIFWLHSNFNGMV